MYKKQMLAIATAATMSLIIACNNGSVNTDNKDSAMATNSDSTTGNTKMNDTATSPMATMTDEMKAIPMTTDFDQDFAKVMIVHHQAAVDMSRKALPKVVDPEIKKMAQTMVDDHTMEIADLNKFLLTHDTTSADHKAYKGANHTHDSGEHHELTDDLNAMMAKTMSLTPTDNADKDYVTMMLAHHQSAVKLSQDELKHGQHDNLKMMAKKMIEDDTKEIKQFEKWLAKTK